MTKMLRALVEWLERKFPDKIIVTATGVGQTLWNIFDGD